MGWTGQNDYQSIHHWPHVFSPCKIVNGISILFLKNQDQAGSDKNGVFSFVSVSSFVSPVVSVFSWLYLYLPRPRICIFLGRVHLALFNLSAKWAIVGANVRSGPDWQKHYQNFKTNILNQTLHNAIECEQWTSAEEKIETNATSVEHHQEYWRFIWNHIVVK